MLIDEFIKRFSQIEVSPDYQPNYVDVNGEPIKEMEQMQPQPTVGKRQLQKEQPDSDDEDTKKNKVHMDIYKERLQKKLIKP